MRKIIVLILMCLNFLMMFNEIRAQQPKLFSAFLEKPVAITFVGDFFMAPTWSPRGDKIAVTSEGYNGIYVIDIASGNIVNITQDPGAGYKFSWSADGNEIAYKSVKHEISGKKLKGIRIVKTEERGRLVTETFSETDVGFPVYSLAHGEFVVSKSGDLQDIEANNLTRNIKGNVVNLSVDGTKIVVDEFGEIIAMNSDGSGRIVLFEGNQFFNPILSPNNAEVMVYESKASGGHIWVVDLNGQNKLDLGVGYWGVWSPDGSTILFNQISHSSYSIIAAELWLMDSNGNNRFQLTDTADIIELHAAWAPDGKKIAYGDLRSGQVFVSDIFVEDVK